LGLNQTKRHGRRTLGEGLPPAAKRIRFGPNRYIAQTQPGFAIVAASEVESRILKARAIDHRSVADKAAMTLFAAPAAAPLGNLRCAEDVFSLTGYGHGVRSDRTGLTQSRAIARCAPFVEMGLMARNTFARGIRSGRRLSFRVVARTVGEHEFRRVDFQRAIEAGITERGDHGWRLSGDDRAEVEFWATLIGAEVFLTIRLSNERMRQREYQVAHRAASLRPAVAAAMAWLSEPRDDDVVLDPMCGAGTILFERAHLGRYALLLGGDIDPTAVADARANAGARYKPIELRKWDAAALPLGASSVDAIVSNLPWGARVGSHRENPHLYPRLLAEFKRLLKESGRMVLLTAETRLMREMISRGVIRPRKILNVTILGAPAAIYVCGAN
jgi:tRNA (guanine6-N2)-methyltransferase